MTADDDLSCRVRVLQAGMKTGSLVVCYAAVFLFTANVYSILPVSVEYVLWLNAPIPVAPLLMALTAVGAVVRNLRRTYHTATRSDLLF